MVCLCILQVRISGGQNEARYGVSGSFTNICGLIRTARWDFCLEKCIYIVSKWFPSLYIRQSKWGKLQGIYGSVIWISGLIRIAHLQFWLPGEILFWRSVFTVDLPNFQVCISGSENKESYKVSTIFDQDLWTDKDCPPSVLTAWWDFYLEKCIYSIST